MADQEGHVNSQVTDAITMTNTKSWHDGHMGIALGMAETHATTVGSMNKSHATTMAALDQTFVASMGSLGKRIVELDISQSVAERLTGGAGQAAVQGDQSAALASTIDQLGAAIAALQQIIKGAQTTPPVTTGG